MNLPEQSSFELDTPARDVKRAPRIQAVNGRRANDLDGARWTRYSISVWSDIHKTAEEKALGHPAMFPLALATRLIECFTRQSQRVILDPFSGIGTTAIAAESLGKVGIGIEINPEYVRKAKYRPVGLFVGVDEGEVGARREIIEGNAMHLLDFVEADSVDMVVTSPPYWDILLQDRSADNKEIRHYGDAPQDLGKIRDYRQFLAALQRVFEQVFIAMKAGSYCCVVVMDLRKKDKFFPYHSDIAEFMQASGFIYDDIIIWDRRHEYNNLKPLGYPSKFRINKTHEYILIFQKPER